MRVLRAKPRKGIWHAPSRGLGIHLDHPGIFRSATKISATCRKILSAIILRQTAGTSTGIGTRHLGIRRPALCLEATEAAPTKGYLAEVQVCLQLCFLMAKHLAHNLEVEFKSRRGTEDFWLPMGITLSGVGFSLQWAVAAKCYRTPRKSAD